MTQAELGDRIKASTATVSAWETRRNPAGLHALDRYHLALGVPMGVMLSISHIAALLRDANNDPSSERRARDKLKLRYLAVYLRNLADHIIEETDAPGAPGDDRFHLQPIERYATMARKEQRGDPDTWSPVIQDLCNAAQKHFDPNTPTPFQDDVRLAKICRKS